MIPEDIKEIIKLLTKTSSAQMIFKPESLQAVCDCIDNLPTIPEPDWIHADGWVTCRTIDPDGDAFWWEREPYVHGATWQSTDEENLLSMYAGHVELPLGIDWRLTLQKKPETNE